MSTTTTGIGAIGLVCIPTVDQDNMIAFYTEKLGFEKRTDVPMGPEYRWVEVYPPVGTTGIALAPPPPGRTVEPKETGITLTTGDADATHAALTAAGSIDLDAEVSRMGDPVPPMFWLRDPEGNSLMVVQTPAS
jgi:predicted enzyme related to lactoylglutathione lyase